MHMIILIINGIGASIYCLYFQLGANTIMSIELSKLEIPLTPMVRLKDLTRFYKILRASKPTLWLIYQCRLN